MARSKMLVALLGLVLAIAVGTALAATEKVLYSFSGGSDGGTPYYGPLVLDPEGNLYGTTQFGGNGSCVFNGIYGCGTVFELSPNPDGTWTEKVLHSFSGIDGDGAQPFHGVVIDEAGNLYGTTFYGGLTSCPGGLGCGIVFELTPSNGSWTESILYQFTGGADGWNPSAGLTLGASGDLYGSTLNGPVVFKLTHEFGQWSYSVIYQSSRTQLPGNLIFNPDHNLYGLGYDGGFMDQGMIGELRSRPRWAPRVIHYFRGGADGGQPFGSLTLDPSGVIYGTATGNGGGFTADSTVFELMPSPNAGWKYKIIYTFCCFDEPYAGVIEDPSGNLFGTTTRGGANEWGDVYELTQDSGIWSQTILYSFTGGKDGGRPYAGLVRDGAGILYGTSINGGDFNNGTVFEIEP